MSVLVSWNNETFTLPEDFDNDWGDDVTDFMVSVAAAALSKAGGQFVLTNEVDFGPNYGLKVAYILSQTADAAEEGVIRLAVDDEIIWEDLALGVNDQGMITFDGSELIDSDTPQPLVNKNVIRTPKFINDDTYVLVEADADAKILISNLATAQQIQIPVNSSVPIPIGTEIPVVRGAPGTVEIVGAPGVILANPYETNFIREVASTIGLVKIDIDTWIAMGDFDNS